MRLLPRLTLLGVLNGVEEHAGGSILLTLGVTSDKLLEGDVVILSSSAAPRCTDCWLFSELDTEGSPSVFSVLILTVNGDSTGKIRCAAASLFTSLKRLLNWISQSLLVLSFVLGSGDSSGKEN